VKIPVRIVLVETSHPGNIGASARAMRTMGLDELVLVAPKHFPSDEATARAAGADEVLGGARVVGTLAEAVADCALVFGASARLRTVALPTVNPRRCAEAVWRHVGRDRAALVFGPEQSGLTNEQLALCTGLVHIPTVPDFGSLNLAMAVQVLCYELRMAAVDGALPAGPAADAPLATAQELEAFHAHLERLLTDAGFLHPSHQRQIKLKLRRIFHRASLDQNEVNILRGVLTAFDPAKRPGSQTS
jgi:TrmH family RNA methyltransferase